MTVDQGARSAAPNLFIIGAPKCGTTSLYDYLVRYPSIAGGQHKEPHYFCDDLQSIRQVTTLRDYLCCYDRHGEQAKYRMDASTCYIYSRTAVTKILEFCPAAKIILMLRNPVELVRSLHDHLVFRQIEPVSNLETAWKLGPVGDRVPNFVKGTPYPGHLSYKIAGALGGRMKLVLDKVPSENLLVLFFDDLIQEPRESMAQVIDFLGLEMILSIDLENRNKAKQLRSPRLNRILMYPPKPIAPIKSQFKKLVPDQAVRKLDLFSRINWTPSCKSQMSEALRLEVADFFTSDVRQLGQMTGRNLDHWLD